MKRISVVVLFLVGCGGASTTTIQVPQPHAIAFDSPDHITLYSINGCEGVEIKANEWFHNYPVLGKLEITDPAARKEMIAALKDGMERRPEIGPKCYIPRHGLRVSEKGKTLDYVVCFQCDRIEEFDGDRKNWHTLINRDVQPMFDKPLQDAGVPLAPK